MGQRNLRFKESTKREGLECNTTKVGFDKLSRIILDYLGNRDLLNLPKTAFLASSTIPTDMVLRCYDWAQQASRGNECIVSGFSSHLEQRVLHFLIKGTCPIILVLARKMYKRVPEELQPLLDNGRLLIISTTSATRQSRNTAYARNQYICELVDKVIMVGVDEGSSLASLQESFSNKLHSISLSDILSYNL